MLDKCTIENLISALCAGSAAKVLLLLEGIKRRGTAAELESARVLLWWVRSYVLTFQYCPT